MIANAASVAFAQWLTRQASVTGSHSPIRPQAAITSAEVGSVGCVAGCKRAYFEVAVHRHICLPACSTAHSPTRCRSAQRHAVSHTCHCSPVLLKQLQVESQIASIQTTIDRRLSSMPPSARQAYTELLAEQQSLLAEAVHFEEGLAELSAALAAAEGELGRNTFKQRALELQVC